MKRRKVTSICCAILTFSLLLTGCRTEQKSNKDAGQTKAQTLRNTSIKTR